MLVDLARNDLSRNGTEVKVEKNRQIQFFSHVIHPVSKVTGKLNPLTNNFQVVADTFPAGTLSGAPKHMALKLIDKYENIEKPSLLPPNLLTQIGANLRIKSREMTAGRDL